MARKKKTYNGYLRTTFVYEGKRYYIYAKTAEELNEKVVAKRAQLKSGEQQLHNPTLRQFYEELTAIRRGEIKESTIRTQKCQFEKVASVEMANGKQFGEMHIRDIKRTHIESVRQKMLDAGHSPQNLNNIFAHLNHVFHRAAIGEIIEKNPCESLNRLKRKDEPIGENRHRALSEEETIKFFQAVDESNSFYKNVFLMMAKTGMRIGEVTALYPTDIDYAEGFIHCRRTITRNEIGGYEVGKDAKTKSGQRDIPLTDELIRIIHDQKQQNDMLYGFQFGRQLLFRSLEGGILREYTVNREIKRLCKKAGIEDFTCHCFRNTFATRFIEQRPQDYKILSEILGHKDVGITLNLYTHVMNESKISAMNELLIKIS